MGGVASSSPPPATVRAGAGPSADDVADYLQHTLAPSAPTAARTPIASTSEAMRPWLLMTMLERIDLVSGGTVTTTQECGLSTR